MVHGIKIESAREVHALLMGPTQEKKWFLVLLNYCVQTICVTPNC